MTVLLGCLALSLLLHFRNPCYKHTLMSAVTSSLQFRYSGLRTSSSRCPISSGFPNCRRLCYNSYRISLLYTIIFTTAHTNSSWKFHNLRYLHSRLTKILRLLSILMTDGFELWLVTSRHHCIEDTFSQCWITWISFRPRREHRSFVVCDGHYLVTAVVYSAIT